MVHFLWHCFIVAVASLPFALFRLLDLLKVRFANSAVDNLLSHAEYGAFCCRRAETVSTKFRYVFLYSGVEKNSHYLKALQLAVLTLQMTCPRYGITVIWNSDATGHAAEKAWLLSRGVDVIQVAPTVQDPERYHHLKLHLWQMTNFDQLAFYDSDMIFFRSPDAAFDECGKSLMCSTHDGPDEFNAGFMVVRPNASEFRRQETSWLERPWDLEQKILNRLHSNVTFLSGRYNLQHAEDLAHLHRHLQSADFSGFPVALHAKYWRLDQTYLQGLLDLIEKTCQKTAEGL